MDENTRLVGSVCLNFNEPFNPGELGYGLHPTYQGKGIMVEALELFLAWIKKQSIVQKNWLLVIQEGKQKHFQQADQKLELSFQTPGNQGAQRL